MSGPSTEDPQLPQPPDPDQEWLRRFEAKMKDLAEAREQAIEDQREQP